MEPGAIIVGKLTIRSHARIRVFFPTSRMAGRELTRPACCTHQVAPRGVWHSLCFITGIHRYEEFP